MKQVGRVLIRKKDVVSRREIIHFYRERESSYRERESSYGTNPGQPPAYCDQLKMSRREATGPPEKRWRPDTVCLIVSTLPQPDLPPTPTATYRDTAQQACGRPTPEDGTEKLRPLKAAKFPGSGSLTGDWTTPGPPGSSSVVSFHDSH